jgi:hypothetical protein
MNETQEEPSKVCFKVLANTYVKPHHCKCNLPYEKHHNDWKTVEQGLHVARSNVVKFFCHHILIDRMSMPATKRKTGNKTGNLVRLPDSTVESNLNLRLPDKNEETTSAATPSHLLMKSSQATQTSSSHKDQTHQSTQTDVCATAHKDQATQTDNNIHTKSQSFNPKSDILESMSNVESLTSTNNTTKLSEQPEMCHISNTTGNFSVECLSHHNPKYRRPFRRNQQQPFTVKFSEPLKTPKSCWREALTQRKTMTSHDMKRLTKHCVLHNQCRHCQC